MKKWTYTVGVDDCAPTVNQLMVTIGKKGVGKVVQIKSVRAVKHKTVRDTKAFRLEVKEVPFLKEFVEYEEFENDGFLSARVWVKGEEALPVYWEKRSKK